MSKNMLENIRAVIFAQCIILSAERRKRRDRRSYLHR